jgi:hypothetical protein
LSLFGNLAIQLKKKVGEPFFVFQKRKTIQNWFCYAGILYGLHIDTFLVNICAKMGHFKAFG